MKTYKQRCREFGLSWPWNATKGELKRILNEYYEFTNNQKNKYATIAEITGFSTDHIERISMNMDDLKKFVKLKGRLPTITERTEISTFRDFKFWFNHHMNGDDFNSVWVYPSEIYHLYHSL